MTKYIICTLLVLSLIGCVSESKKRFRAEQFYNEHKEEFANKCAEQFKVQTKYVQGSTVTLYDTLIVKGDSVDCPTLVKYVERAVKVKCPDSKIIKVSRVRVDTFKVENTAKVEALKLLSNRLNTDISVIKAQLNSVETQSSNRLKLLILFMIISFFTVFKPFKS